VIGGVEVSVGGAALDAALADRINEVRVDHHAQLPDAFSIRISDPGLEHMDKSPFKLGAEVEIKFASPDGGALTSLFTGQVLTVEPDFTVGHMMLAARGYDYAHVLHRSSTSETYQDMTVGDIAKKVAARAGFQTGEIADGGGVYHFVQQSNETDWNFLWRLARRVDCDVVVDKRTLHFRKASSSSATVSVRWGEGLTTFRPRVTGVQQVDQVIVRSWDPKSKKAVDSVAKDEDGSSAIGVERSSVRKALGGGQIVVSDRPVSSPEEGDALAKSLLAQLGNAYLEAEGTTRGDPRLRAGVVIAIDGIGERFKGNYALASTSHVFRGTTGYQTHFTISGRSPRTLIDLVNPSPARSFGTSVVVGVVTQNEDPDNMGRVRIKYPALGDDVEGWWARLAAPGAGKGRGQLMMPIKDDEVLVAFEHGDIQHPYILGSLWNGSDTPDDLVQTDGSYALHSDHKIAISAKEGISVKGEDTLELESKGDMKITTTSGASITQDAAGELKIKGGTSVTIEAGTTLTIKGSSISIEGQTVAVKGMVQLG
jgi:phage protein D